MFKFSYFLEVFPIITSKLPVTLQVTLIGTVVALIIGIILSVINYYKIPVLHILAKMYISIIRGTPAITQLYFFYIGIAMYSQTVRNMEPLTAVAIVISLNIGAFMSESIRGALLSVDEGQKEAAYSLGISNLQIMRRIVLPQAFRVAMPALFNDVINIIKLSSLGFILGVADIMGAAKIEGSVTFRFFEVYAAVMIIYWVIIFIFSQVSKAIEKKYRNLY